MFGRWFGRRGAARPGRIAEGRAVYAVGDIHGRLDLLEDLLRRISADAERHADASRILVFLGDYIDRGPESRGVIGRLIDDPLAGFETVRLMGNHEEAMLDFLDGHSDGLDWLSFGGLETLLSYQVPLKALPNTLAAVTELRRSLALAVPGRHVDFLRNSVLSHAEGDYLFVHAGVRPGLALDKQTAHDLLWIRDDFLRVRVPVPNHVVVHGHTIVDQPQNREHRVNVDTGAFISGRLTCLVLRGTERRFITTLDG